MSTASSSSSRHGTRRNIIGVPTRCWCGQNIQPFVSETKENPCRRFYRCEIAIKRKTESHLFKWEDEAFLDEIRMVDAKCQNLVHDFQNLSKNVHLELQTHKQWFSQTGEELSAKLQDNFIKMKAQVDSSIPATYNEYE